MFEIWLAKCGHIISDVWINKEVMSCIIINVYAIELQWLYGHDGGIYIK